MEEKIADGVGGVSEWEHYLRTRKNLILHHSILFWVALLAASRIMAFSIYTRDGRRDPLVLTTVHTAAWEQLLRLDTRDNPRGRQSDEWHCGEAPVQAHWRGGYD